MTSIRETGQTALDVVFGCDWNYIPHLAVAVESLIRNSPEVIANIWVITDQSHTRRYKKFTSHLLTVHEIEIRTIDISRSELSGLFTSGHVTLAAYNRFLIGRYLPPKSRFVLYLDSDLLVSRDLTPLVDFRLSVKTNSATQPVLFAIRRDDASHLKPFGHSGDKLFNSGVMLLDLLQWRSQGVEEELFATARKYYGQLRTRDQDVLNLVLEDRWVELPGEYNETTAVDDRNDSARIIHFAGSVKPWMVGSNHPHRQDYDSYRALTPFSPYRKEGLGRFLFKKFVPTPLQKPQKLIKKSVRRVKSFLGQAAGS